MDSFKLSNDVKTTTRHYQARRLYERGCRVLRLGLFFLVGTSFCAARAAMLPCPSESSIAILRGGFDASPGVHYDLTNFRARLTPKSDIAPDCYARTTAVFRARIFVTSESLTNVFALKLREAHSKIRDFKVQHDADGATLSGTITKILPLHFSIQGPVTTDGKVIRLDAKSVKADGIPAKELLKLIGLELDSLLPLKNMKGIQVEGDSLSFSPEALADLKGHIESVTTSKRGLTLVYGLPAKARTLKR